MVEFPKTGNPGRPRQPIQVLLSELRYAQVVKTRIGGRIVDIRKRIVYGREEEIAKSEISTSYIERQNLTLRQENNRLTRKTLGYSKNDNWLGYQAVFYMTHYNFVRTHDGLKIPKVEPVQGKVYRKYKKQTPMMSLGVTNHVWSLRELLQFPYYKISTK